MRVDNSCSSLRLNFGRSGSSSLAKRTRPDMEVINALVVPFDPNHMFIWIGLGQIKTSFPHENFPKLVKSTCSTERFQRSIWAVGKQILATPPLIAGISDQPCSPKTNPTIPRQSLCPKFISSPITYLPTHHHSHHIHATDVNATTTMLYLVGLGLADEKDITVKGLEIVRKAERVYLEAYTAILLVDQAALV